MKNIKLIALFVANFIATTSSHAQPTGETITSSILSYGSGSSTRTSSNQFGLRVDEQTSDVDTQTFLGLLQSCGQDDLLIAIKNQEVGRFSVGGRLARDVNVVCE